MIVEVPAHLSETEEWRPVPGADGWYEVSSLGRVRSWRTTSKARREEPVLMHPTQDKSIGYLRWCHRLSGKEARLTVHRTVCEAFHGAPPKGIGRAEVRHLDGDPLNNRADNLAWGTPKENAADRVRHGTSLAGERNPFAKLTTSEVVSIRALYSEKWGSFEGLAGWFGVSPATVKRIISRETWRNV